MLPSYAIKALMRLSRAAANKFEIPPQRYPATATIELSALGSVPAKLTRNDIVGFSAPLDGRLRFLDPEACGHHAAPPIPKPQIDWERHHADHDDSKRGVPPRLVVEQCAKERQPDVGCSPSQQPPTPRAQPVDHSLERGSWRSPDVCPHAITPPGGISGDRKQREESR